MNGPSLGTFSSPMTVGRQVEVTSPRVVQRIASNIAIGVHLVYGVGQRVSGHCVRAHCGGPPRIPPGNGLVEGRAAVHDLHRTGRVQFAVRSETPAYADA